MEDGNFLKEVAKVEEGAFRGGASSTRLPRLKRHVEDDNFLNKKDKVEEGTCRSTAPRLERSKPADPAASSGGARRTRTRWDTAA